MSSKVDIQRNKLMHLENTLVMYGVYDTETLEKLIKTGKQYTADKLCTRVYLQDRYPRLMNIIHKCMEIVVYNIMPLAQWFI